MSNESDRHMQCELKCMMKIVDIHQQTNSSFDKMAKDFFYSGSQKEKVLYFRLFMSISFLETKRPTPPLFLAKLNSS